MPPPIILEIEAAQTEMQQDIIIAVSVVGSAVMLCLMWIVCICYRKTKRRLHVLQEAPCAYTRTYDGRNIHARRTHVNKYAFVQPPHVHKMSHTYIKHANTAAPA